MERKTYRGTLDLKALGDATPEGAFRATFSRFNVVDLDHDVTLPGAFQLGQAVRIASWGHKWSELPVGRGVIQADAERAWVDGQFFLDTAAGLDTYRTVKQLQDLQEWSYGFDILERSFGEWEGQEVQFLRRLDVFEVSPVLLGAGIGTGTDTIKGLADPAALQADVARVLTHWQGLVAHEAKEGRVLSEANRQKLGALAASVGAAARDLDALVQATAPAPPKLYNPRRLFAELLAVEARLNGVAV